MATTLKEARAILGAYCITLSKKDDEYKVRIKGSPKGHGYFTDDIDDAVATGKSMANAQRMNNDNKDYT